MSTMYGGGGYADFGPPRKVNFGWIGESWGLFGQSAGVWVAGVLLYGVLNLLVTALFKQVFPNPNYVALPSPFGGHTFYNFGISYGTNSQLTPLGQVLHLLFTWAFGAFQSASLYHMAVTQVRGRALALGDLFSGGPYWGNMLLFNLVAVLAFFAGILALCVGIFVAGGLLLPGQAQVADGRSAAEALSESINGMKNDWLTASLFVLVFSLLIVVSLVPCGLGLFATVPMLYLTGALAYRDMVGMPGGGAAIGPTPGGYGAPQPGVWPPPPASGQAPPPNWGSLPGRTPPGDGDPPGG